MLVRPSWLGFVPFAGGVDPHDAVPVVPEDYTGPLDIVAGAVLAYSAVRALSKDKLGSTGPKLRRSTDDAEQAFTYDVGTGIVAESSIASFLGVGSGYVSQLNDQSGHDNHLANAETTSQFEWHTSLFGSLPGMKAPTSMFLEKTSPSGFVIPGGSTPLNGVTVFIVASQGLSLNGSQALDNADFTVVVGDETIPTSCLVDLVDSDSTHESGIVLDSGQQVTGVQIFEAAWTYGTREIMFDGVAASTVGSTVTDVASEPSNLTFDGSFSVYAYDSLNTKVFEVLVYPSLLTSQQRTAIRENIAAAYSITL